MSGSDNFVPVKDASVAEELVTLFHQLGFAVIVRHPDTVDVIASSPHAEAIHLAAAPGSVRIASARVGGQRVRVELLRSPDDGHAELTPRQVMVARLLADGLRNKEIADRLGISTHTVRRHLEAVFRRLEVPNRAAAAAALRSGRIRLTEIPDDATAR